MCEARNILIRNDSVEKSQWKSFFSLLSDVDIIYIPVKYAQQTKLNP